jgi:ABC-type sulfate transport system permease component
MKIPAIRHVRGFDVARPVSIGMMLGIMLPLVLLPLLSIFIYGTSKGLGVFWSSLAAPEAVFALKLSIVTSFWATAFNVVFGLFAAYVLSRYDFWGRNAVIVTISLPTAIPTAVAGFALLLLWGKYGTIGRFFSEDQQIMFTPYAIVLANIFVTFPLAFGVIKPVFDTMSRSLEEASATIGATRWQTFWAQRCKSARRDRDRRIADLCARGRRIRIDNPGFRQSCRTHSNGSLYIFAKFNEGQIEAANAIAIVLALLSFVIFSVLFFARDWLDFEAQDV